MHFWINKGNQGCGYNGRYLVPPSLSGPRRNQRLLCGGVHPKLMVTPVHRFQSIESVANGGIRHPRTPNYQTRFPLHCQPPVQYNASGSGHRNNAIHRSMELIDNSQTANVRNGKAPAAKLKCLVWAFFAVVTFFIAGARYYLNGASKQAVGFCLVLVAMFVLLGLFSLYEVILSSKRNNAQTIQLQPQISTEQQILHDDVTNHVPNNQARTIDIAETPPPPYHIAITLRGQDIHEPPDIIRDSPPPSYDKAVT